MELYCASCGQEVTPTEHFFTCGCETVEIQCWVEKENLPEDKKEEVDGDNI